MENINDNETIEAEVPENEDISNEAELSIDELRELYNKEREEKQELRRKLDNNSDKYRETARQRDIYNSAFTRVIKALKQNNIADVDDDLNIIIKNAPAKEVEKNKDEIEELEFKINSLKKSYDNDEIDHSEYTEKMSDLKAHKRIIEYDRAKMAQEKELDSRNKKEADEREMANRQAAAYRILQEQYPDNENENSELFREMNAIYSEDPSIWNGRLDTDRVDRLKLARMAAARLSNTKKEVVKNMQNPKSEGASFDSRPYPKPNTTKKLSEYGENIIIRSGIKDDGLKKSLTSQIMAIENIQEGATYFSGSSNRVSIDI